MQGLDLSHYDGWPYKQTTEEAYKDADFVIVKASQGTSYKKYADYFPKAINRALADGKLIGAYHYAAGNKPEDEADYFLSCVEPYLGQILLTLDWEAGQNKAWGDTNWCKRFVDRIREKTWLACVIYTGMDGVKQCANLGNVVPLWFAAYPKNDNSWKVPAWPSRYKIAPWREWTIWQFTSGNDTVDRNTTWLTPDDWRQLAGGSAEKEPYTGTFPNLPRRGYYREGDGYRVLTGTRPSIRAIQTLVNWITGSNLDVDGKYGPKTAAAVVNAQRILGVTADGLFGKDTLTAARKMVE